MVNPGAFIGSRFKFLEAQKEIYSAAVVQNNVSDIVADIQRRYFKRFPITLPHTEEPSAEWLEQVDDNAPDREIPQPDQNALDDASYEAAMKDYNELLEMLKFRKAQIARRLQYQYTKSRTSSPKIHAGSEDPMAVLMAKLTGIPIKKPRQKAAYSLWGSRHRFLTDPIFEDRVKKGNIPKKQHAALRSALYKQCFEELGPAEHGEWEALAIQEHKDAVKKIDDALNKPPSTDPADIQRILQGLPAFIQPILDLIVAHTQWKATLILGGPEPADEGRLNLMSFHSGETAGAVKMNFGKAERTAYRDFILPIFGNFLKKCYSVENCRAFKLPETNTSDSVPLSQLLTMDSPDVEFESASTLDNVFIKISKPRQPSSMPTPSRPPLIDRNTPSGPPKMMNIHLFDPMLPVESPARVNQPFTDVPSGSLSSAPICHFSNAPLIYETPTSFIALPASDGQYLNEVQSVGPSPAPSPHPSPIPASTEKIPFHAAWPPILPTDMSALPCAGPSSTTAQPLMLIDSIPFPLHFQDIVHTQTAEVQLNPDTNPNTYKGHIGVSSVGASTAYSPVRRKRSIDDVDKEDKLLEEDPDIEPSIGSKTEHKRPRRQVASTVEVGRRKSSRAAKPKLVIPPPFDEIREMFLGAEELEDCSEWMDLVQLWTEFERSINWQGTAKLKAENRPIFVSDWIAKSRPTVGWRPILSDLAEVEATFKAWWISLQPSWRIVKSKPHILLREGGSLEDLRRPGKNGLMSVIAALFFWGIVAKKKRGRGGQKQWSYFVEDVK